MHCWNLKKPIMNKTKMIYFYQLEILSFALLLGIKNVILCEFIKCI